MKKCAIFIFPLLAMPFLINCGKGGGDVPEPTYTVTWKNWDDTILRVDVDLHNGDMPNYGEPLPTRESSYATYTFSNWTPTIEPINNANQVYVAQYTAEYNCDACFKVNIPDNETEVNLTCEGEVESVDWGDGTDSSNTPSHTYSLAGDYYIKITGNVTNVSIDKNKLVTTFFMGSTITTINFSAFSECQDLTLVEIEEGSELQTIGGYAFYHCTNLTSFIIPDKVTTIGHQAFDSCKSLKSIRIPSSVTLIDLCAFVGCSNVESIVVDPNNPNYDSRDNCNAIITKESGKNYDGNTLIVACKATTFIPESVTSIYNYAFQGIETLTSIYIPKSVKTIGYYAFNKCTGLTSVVFDDDSPVTKIDDFTFCSCHSLTSITLPKNLKEIGDHAFSSCNTLPSITLPDGLETIEAYAFSSTNSLSFISIPDTVTSIGTNAFYNSGITSIDLPKGITLISDCMFESAGLTSIDINEGITSIGNGAFQGCTQLASVTLPSSLNSIGEYAFQNCRSLPSIDFPESITSIGKGAFARCESLEIVFIPSSVTTMGADVFKDCNNLVIFCQADSKPEGWDNNWNSSGCSCYFGYLDYGEEGPYTYILTSNGSTIVKYSGTDSNLTIPDTIAESKVVGIAAKVFYDNDTLVSVNFPSTLKTIGNSAFEKCSNIKTIKFPSALETIGDSAFNHANLTAIDFGTDSHLKTIGSDAFNTNNIVSVDIPDSVTSIESQAFNFCSKLEQINFGANSTLKKIGSLAFWNCRKLKEINLPNTLTTLEERAFSSCDLITSIRIPASVTYINSNYSPFAECENIEEIVVDPGNTKYSSGNNCNAIIENETHKLISGCKKTIIPNGVTIICQGAFEGCGGLTDIILPNGITNINSNAFCACKDLASVVIPNTVTKMGIFAFCSCLKLMSVDLSAFIDPNIIPSGANQAFVACPSDIVFYVANADMLKAFESHKDWSEFAGHFVVKV